MRSLYRSLRVMENRASERVEFVSHNRPGGRGAGVRAYHEGMADSGFQHELADRCDPALIAILRRQTPAQKLAVLDGMWRSARTLVAAGVRAQHPTWSEANLAQEVAARMSHGAVPHV